MRTVDDLDDIADGDIVVCQMTNPAWVVLFTKNTGLVTDTGGATSHPAVLAREFGVPAVVGASDATHRIATGDADGRSSDLKRGCVSTMFGYVLHCDAPSISLFWRVPTYPAGLL